MLCSRPKQATTTVPIVFLSGEDPVSLGLVSSLAHPGGNMTGINFFNRELAGKQLEFLCEFVPSANRIAVLVNPADTTVAETTVREVEAAAGVKGLQVQVIRASTSREIDAAFAVFNERAAGRAVYCSRSFLQQSASSTFASRNASRSAYRVFRSRIC